MILATQGSRIGSKFMKFSKRGIRATVLGLAATAGLALAPAAFAHGTWGIGINAPGVSIGYWGGHHHGGYVGINGGYYGGYYAPAYTAPVYYDYYEPAPIVERVYYTRPVYRHHYYRRYYDSYCGCYR